MEIEKYGNGVPIVFIHGAGGSTLSWGFQKTHFEGSYTVFLVDLPGHGRSDGPSSASIGGYSEALKETFEENAITSAFIAGHSMGGRRRNGLRYAVSRPCQGYCAHRDGRPVEGVPCNTGRHR